MECWDIKTIYCVESLLNILNKMSENFHQNTYYLFNDDRLINFNKDFIIKEIINIYLEIKEKIIEFNCKLKQHKNICMNLTIEKTFISFEDGISKIIKYIEKMSNIISNFNIELYVPCPKNLSNEKYRLINLLRNLKIFKYSENSKLENNISNMLNEKCKNEEKRLRKMKKKYEKKMKICEKYIFLINNYLIKSENISIEEIDNIENMIYNFIH